MAATNRALPWVLLAFVFVAGAASLVFVWLATRVAVPPPAPTPVNDSSVSTSGTTPPVVLPPAQPPSNRVSITWRAPVFVSDATPACGYDSLLALRGGEDTLYVQTQVMPLWMGARVVYQVGRWASEGAMLIAVNNETLPITRCGGGDAWDRADNLVAANGLLVAYVETGAPITTAALYVHPLKKTLTLVDPSERPSHLVFSNGEFDIYSWSAASSKVYLRRSVDGGLSWSPPRRLLDDAVRPRLVDTGRVQLLAAYQPTTRNVRFLLHTSDWAPAATRVLVLSPGVDCLEGGYRNISQRMRLVATSSGLHVFGSDARSTRSILVSARSCNASDVYPGCSSSPVLSSCTPNPNALASACVRLAIPQLHHFHAVSENDALSFHFVGESDGDQTALLDADVLSDGRVAVLYYRVRISLMQMELRLRVGSVDFLIDTFDGVSQAASEGGLAYDSPVLRLDDDVAVYVAYSRPAGGVAQPETYTLDTRERSRMTVVRVAL